MELIDEKPVMLSEVKEKLLKLHKKQSGTLGYEQQKTLDYVEKFAKLDVKKQKELVKKLEEFGLSYEVAVKLSDLLPSKNEELTAIVSEFGGIEEDKKKDVLKTIKEYI
ncbi:RNA polymerase Rpb4 [uncultured archaeon]|nr:RNA polymerase Rpb4 [uncultured archaeon]